MSIDKIGTYAKMHGLKVTIWQNGKLMNGRIDHTSSWWNSKLILRQVDDKVSWWKAVLWNNKLTKQQLMKGQVDKVATWWNSKLTKCKAEKMEHLQNSKTTKNIKLN